MPKDIIKQILVKFNGDNTNLKKTIEDSARTAATLSKSSSLNQQYGAMDKFIKNVSKTNENLSKTFTIFQKGMKGVIEGDMQKFERRTEAQYKRIKNLQVELDKASQAGDNARAAKIERVMGVAGRKMTGAMTGYNQASQALTEGAQPGFAGGFGRGVAGAMGIPVGMGGAALGVAAAAAAVKAMQIYGNSEMQKISNVRGLTDISRGYFAPGMRGDISTAFTMANDPSAMRRAETAAGGRGGAITAPGLFKAAGRIIASNLATGMGLLGDQRLDYARREQQDIAQNFENIKQSTMTPEKLAYLQANNPARLSFQRQFGLNDIQRFNIAKAGRDQLMSESETLGVSGALRERLGARSGAVASAQAGMIRKTFGMDLGLAASMVGGIGNITGGGVPDEKKTIEIIGKAFKSGIEDYQLAEKITSASIDAIEKTGMIGDPSERIKRISELAVAISPDGQANARTVAGALGVSEAQRQALSAGGSSQHISTQVLNRLAAQTTNPELALNILQKEYSRDPEKLKNIQNDPALMALVDKDKRAAFGKSATGAVNEIVAGNLSLYGVDPEAILRSELKKGKSFEEARDTVSAFIKGRGPVSNLTTEQQRAFTTDILKSQMGEKYDTLAPSGGKDYLSDVMANQKKINESKTGEIGKLGLITEGIMDQSTINMEAKQFAAAGLKQSEMLKAGMSGGINGSIDGVIQALEALKGSIKTYDNSSQSRAGGG